MIMMNDSAFNRLNDIWEHMTDLFDTVHRPDVKNTGLKTAIVNPHNLYAIKDADGKVVKNILKVVTTPFKKEDIEVAVEDDVVTVNIGRDMFVDKDSDSIIYHGISNRNLSFQLHLTEAIDKDAITASVEDGVLTVEFPFKRGEPPAEQRRVIDIA